MWGKKTGRYYTMSVCVPQQSSLLIDILQHYSIQTTSNWPYWRYCCQVGHIAKRLVHSGISASVFGLSLPHPSHTHNVIIFFSPTVEENQTKRSTLSSRLSEKFHASLSTKAEPSDEDFKPDKKRIRLHAADQKVGLGTYSALLILTCSFYHPDQI